MKRLLLAASLAFSITPVLADEITDAVEEGSAAYKRGELGTAASQWEYAAQLARQNKAAQVVKLLPKPLAGWEASEADSSAAGTAMFGGGINVSRNYTQGESNVRIELTMDSPMLQGVLGMISNPQMAAMSGQKVKKIKGNSAAIESTEGHTKVQIVVANSTLIVVEGSPEKAVMEYAESIDFKGLTGLK